MAGKTSIYVRSSLECRAALIGLQLSLQHNCRIGSCSNVDFTVTKASSFKIHNLGNEFGGNVLASWLNCGSAVWWNPDWDNGDQTSLSLTFCVSLSPSHRIQEYKWIWWPCADVVLHTREGCLTTPALGYHQGKVVCTFTSLFYLLLRYSDTWSEGWCQNPGVFFLQHVYSLLIKRLKEEG